MGKFAPPGLDRDPIIFEIPLEFAFTPSFWVATIGRDLIIYKIPLIFFI